MPTNTCSNRGLPDIYYVYQYGTAQVMCKLNGDKIGEKWYVTLAPEGWNIAHNY